MIPNEFLLRMKALLGKDYDAFCEAMEQPPVRSFRVNPLKTDVASFLKLNAIDATPIPDCDGGFYTDCEKPGALGAHHAGMIYMQDPSAMTTVRAVTIEKDWKILDACAAPGGKSTQLAACAPDGLLVANEPSGARCRILQGNIERMGVRNAIVTQTEPPLLAKTYPNFFDLVLTDAPCSGEGMFRKYSVAGEEWSQDNVLFCAQRQKEILNETAKCVKVGGYLLYSTCTFSVEENEAVICDFLQHHPEFLLCEVEDCVKRRTAPGISQADFPYDLSLTRRFYPHLCPGEGQYIALLQKAVSTEESAPTPADLRAALTKQEEATVSALLKELLSSAAYQKICEKLRTKVLIWQKSRDTVYLCPNSVRPTCHIYTYGTAFCTLVGNRAVPHHHFYSAYGKEFANQCHLCDPDRIARYLRGEEIPAPDSQNGFCAVLIHGSSVGGGKVSGGTLKNHYPKGLRNH